ncbi:Glycosyltransferase involved in cell wall bisynthesis [Roseivivax lentus]|uniref:Glycosyltransferase involved in cell wall bisynthesis n=1 Tax=Roseivivax lentus TaxID=633194 RepID=A0A1N7PE54_9RHOB|nr:glycosyltransferase family 4 protein [Roseivivax lentus]SIT08913.1 Glycosyltransferase involved in cell wall bisynthesis [Roseivivax lentus]
MTTLAPPVGRIGYVLKRYPRFSETFVVTEILAHEAAGQEIDIFALRSVEETHFQDMLGRVRAPVTRLKDRFSGTEGLWHRLDEARAELPGAWEALRASDGIASGRDVAQALELAVLAKRRGLVHLHAHFGTVATSVARLAAAMAGIGYSFTAHAKDIYHDYEDPQHLDLKLRDADLCVTVSDYNLAHLRDRFGPGPRLTRVYNGLDLDRFAYKTPSPEAREILAVGRLVEKKGFHILIEAIRLMAQDGLAPVCRIVGDGEEREDLARQIEDAGVSDHVVLEGPRPQSEVIEMIRGAALMACPCVVGSDGNRDGMPTVLVEAMALGLPVVSSDVVGIPELVQDDETGLIAPASDPEALAAAMTRLLDDAALRDRLSASARARIERDFDARGAASALRAQWAETLSARPSAKEAA